MKINDLRCVEPWSIIGKYAYSVIGESDDQWIVNCSEITKAEVSEYRPGQWGGSYDMRDELAVIGKNSDEAIRMEVFDDLDPDQRKRLEELHSQIDENSNPVVFVFKLKNRILITT
ncbi:MAG: hypothetical protein K9J25_12865 [Bacteroidales bacterium]|nr:hypothetical protein [Bacteroidales bacterium]